MPEREREASELRVAAKYALLQLPGVAIAGGLAFAIGRAFGWPDWIAAAIAGGWLMMDAALYPVLRDSYRTEPHRPGADLIGRLGLVESRIAPEGTIGVGAERWRARVAAGQPPIEEAARVRVVEIEGLTLIVEPDSSEEAR